MKLCPSCQQTYADDAPAFCPHDGVRLVVDALDSFEPQATMQSSSNYGPQLEASEARAEGTAGTLPQQQPPPFPIPTFPQPGDIPPPEKQRSRLPLMIGVGAVVLLLLAGVGALALKWSSRSPANTNEAGESLGASDSLPNSNQNDNVRLNSGAKKTTATTNSNANTNQPNVLNELIAVQKEWKEAKLKGDTATLKRIFADEFVNKDDKGKTYNKAQWVAALRRGFKDIKSWDITDARLLSQSGDRARMSAIFTYRKARRADSTRDTDTFVKRDGRWQVISSTSANVK
jgi:hypothetical protein